MKTILSVTTILVFLLFACDDFPHFPNEGSRLNHVKKYPADVAISWINLQQKLIKTTSGFDPLVASRSFAYSGLAIYESLVKGMPSYRSIVSPRIGTDINQVPNKQVIHWSASANAAMAYMLKNLFANTSAANKSSIDSLEAVFNSKFERDCNAAIIAASAQYGRTIAEKIFEWSKTDGGHEAYLQATNSNYIPPTGPGMWIPTPPANSQPIRPYWGNNRSFVANSATETMPAAPPAYSEDPASQFYTMAHEVYTRSQSLSEDDIRIVKHWADLPGNYGTPGHYTNIATQLIQREKFNLEQAVLAYVKHGIAINEALICVFKAKYTYNLIRPVSYIRNVLGHTTWSTVVGTPAHPEYPSAHAVVGGASSEILESVFGKNYSFVDRTHEQLYGVRTYNSLQAYAEEAAASRFLGGIHYKYSAEIGLKQGEKIGMLVINMPFKGGWQHK
jgi:hypothetical protein